MLQVLNGAVSETAAQAQSAYVGDFYQEPSNSACVLQYGWWQTYPVYVHTDKTKKAIDVLKALEADGLKVQSVKKFIELVEKIAAIL